jgi:hypothetical protein
MDCYLRKVGPNLFSLDMVDESGQRWFDRLKLGAVIKVVATLVRNYQFHKKFFKMLTIAMDWWQPTAEHQGVRVAKNMERFRDDLLIMAGYRYPVVNLRGEVRWKAESISFASMEQDVFEKLYSDVLNVILDEVLGRVREAEFKEACDALMSFA